MDGIDTIDGRTARRNRNKDAVLDALIALAQEGDDEPTVEAIAERARVSYRSVYRYFEDRTELMLSAIGRVLGLTAPFLTLDDLGVGTIDERLTRFVDSRVAGYRALAPLARFAVRRRAHEPAVAESYERLRLQFYEQMRAQFAPELSALDDAERVVALAALDVVFQFEALDYLGHEKAMSDAEIGQVLRRHLRAHLAVVVDD